MNVNNQITQTSADNNSVPDTANKVKVSVIVPVYKDEKYIERCLYSLLNQSLKEIEFIFIDDCGGDNSISVVEKEAALDNRIQIIYNEKNIGAGLSRNRGIESARGEYLGFVDADDEVDLNFYEKLYALAVKYNSDVSKGQRVNYLLNGTKQKGLLTDRLSKFGEYSERQDWFFYFSFEHQTAVYRRDFIKKENIRYSNTIVAEDTIFLLQMMYYAHKVAFCHDAYYHYYIRKDRLSTTRRASFYEANIQNFDERIKFLCNHPAEKDVVIQYVQGRVDYLLTLYQSIAGADNNRIRYNYLCGIENALEHFIYKDSLSEHFNKVTEYKKALVEVQSECNRKERDNTEVAEMKLTQDVIGIKESINENILIIQLILKGIPDDAVWQVEIFFEGKVVKRWTYSRETVFAFGMEKSGNYGLKVLVKDKSEQYHPLRKSVKYYTEEILDGYKNFISSDITNTDASYSLPLYCPAEPFQNMGIIYANGSERISSLNEHEEKIRNTFLNMNYTVIWESENSKVLALSQQLPFQNQIIFSGRTKYDRKIVFGQKDLVSSTDYDILLDEIGVWTAIKYNQQKIVFTNDYFGMYKLYIYNVNGIVVATNNYHMLLLILKSMNIKMTLNVDNALPYLLKAEGGFLEQRFSEKMDIENITALAIDKYIEISQSGIQIKEKSISKTLNGKNEYDESQYETMMKQAAEEIKENVEIALADERFENIVFDLTGGKDSRTVFAALLAVDGKEGRYRDKVRINTLDIADDKDTAIGVNNIFNYKYDDLARSYNLVKLVDKEEINRSFFMGTSYSRPFPGERIISDETNSRILNITGAGAECDLRPYYVAGIFGIPTEFFDLTDVDEILNLYINTVYETWSVCVPYEKCKENLHKEIKNAVLELPGYSLKEKFDMFYQFYRNVYHFGMQTVITSIEASVQWQPLYSKSAFKAFRMIFNKHCDIKFQLDLIAQLCPVCAILPFESASDNENVKKLMDELYIDNVYKKMKITLDHTAVRWEEAKQKKKGRMTIANESESKYITEANIEYRNNFYDHLFDMLKILLTSHYEDLESIGLDLFAYFSREREKFEGKNIPRSTQFLFNKIVSLIDEIMLIEH